MQYTAGRMRTVDVIIRKRDGGVLTHDQIKDFVQGVTAGNVPDYQASALLMAMFCRGMSPDETGWLTDAMAGSGIRLDLSDVPGVKVDKHSTGGVGDKTSLIVAPLAATCGVVVPMLTGRGLGHTGGTLDKLESIPGFRIYASIEEMKRMLRTTGCVMLGQTSEMAPADKKLYALRDVTGTIESLPLITASIMSKKIAEGIDGLVLDVKTGRGAFVKSAEESRRLAHALVSVGNASGIRTQAVITVADAPLGRAVGNALEVIECLEVLKGGGPSDLIAIAVELAARMLVLGRVTVDQADAERRLRGALASGAALERFRRILEQQGGDPRVIDDYARLPTAAVQHVVTASREGYIGALDAELVGLASMALGAGRSRVDDAIDPAVGITVLAKPGERVGKGDGVLALHYRDSAGLAAAVPLATRAIAVDDVPPVLRQPILAHVS